MKTRDVLWFVPRYTVYLPQRGKFRESTGIEGEAEVGTIDTNPGPVAPGFVAVVDQRAPWEARKISKRRSRRKGCPPELLQ